MTEMLSISKVALFPHPERVSAWKEAERFAVFLAEEGVEALIREELAGCVGVPVTSVPEKEIPYRADLAVSFGGDGTFLRTVRAASGLPVAGVNCGELGYLAEVPIEDLQEFADAVARGILVCEDRLALHGEVEWHANNRSSQCERPSAVVLNDFVFDKRAGGRVVKLRVCVDGTRYATLRADALVVATPTGSTAYNFSARGPLVTPDLQVILVTPVAPHGLWDRSLVLGPGREVQVEVTDDRRAAVFADGAPCCDLAQGDRFFIRAADQPVRVVRWRPFGYIERLRAAFDGRGDLAL